MQKNHIRERIAAARVRTDENLIELMHLEELEMSVAGQSDYVEDLATMMLDAMTIDGRDERRTARALSYAGLRTSWH